MLRPKDVPLTKRERIEGGMQITAIRLPSGETVGVRKSPLASFTVSPVAVWASISDPGGGIGEGGTKGLAELTVTCGSMPLHVARRRSAALGDSSSFVGITVRP